MHIMDKKRGMAVAVAAFVGLALAGCASTDAGPNAASAATFTPVAQDSSAPITVWTDSTRKPMVDAFIAANPGIKVNAVTIDSSVTSGADSFRGKISLLDKAGSGWPDIVWSSITTDASWAAVGNSPFAAPLDEDIVPQSTLNNFAKGALDPCTVNGHVYCLRNDLAQNVFWYNKTLMDQFGYTVPTTWEDLQALSDKVAADHPGYVLGSIGDSNALYVYFWGSKCPANVLNGNTVSSNTSDPNCTRAAQLIDHMIANKTMVTDGVFDAAFTNQYAGKVLGLAGPSWFGQYLFNLTLKVPAGQVTAANPLKWAADSDTATGNVGGGSWFLSAHSKNIANATKLLTYVATDSTLQSKQPTYPAYGPAAVAWLANSDNTKYFATDVSTVFKTAANEVWTGWSLRSLIDQQGIFKDTVVAGLVKGQSMVSLLPAWRTAVQQQASTLGYTFQ